jgi:hypothetical protein
MSPIKLKPDIPEDGKAVSHTPVQAFEKPVVRINIFKDVFTCFCTRVNLAGLNKLIDGEYGFIRRAIWLICILGMIAFGLYQTSTQVMKFNKRPINVLVNISREGKMELPTITVCNFNVFSKAKLDKAGPGAVEFVKSVLNTRSGLNLTAFGYDFTGWNWHYYYRFSSQRLNESLLEVSR